MKGTQPKTEVIIAVISLVGVLVAALIANWDKFFPPSNTNSSTNINSFPPSQSPVPGPSRSESADCIAAFLNDVPKDRVATLEAGAKDLQIIAPQQAKDQPIAVKLEENSKLVGAVKFQFYSNGSMFKIHSIVNSHCQPLEDFANVSRGGDKHVLQNYDDLQIQFGNATYMVSYEYGAGKIDVDFARISPNP